MDKEMKISTKQELRELDEIIKNSKKHIDCWNKIITHAKERKNKIYKDFMKKCKHPEEAIRILQFVYDSSGDSDHVPEKRVCSFCGYTEIGKTTGYQGEYEFNKLKCKTIRGINGNCINEKEYKEISRHGETQ